MIMSTNEDLFSHIGLFVCLFVRCGKCHSSSSAKCRLRNRICFIDCGLVCIFVVPIPNYFLSLHLRVIQRCVYLCHQPSSF